LLQPGEFTLIAQKNPSRFDEQKKNGYDAGMKTGLLILATRSMSSYADRVIERIKAFPEFNGEEGASIKGTVEVATFADGEMEVAISSSIRGKDVFLFAGASHNELDLTVEQNKIEEYLTVDALRRSQPSRIALFEPYVSCSRSDRTTRRNSVGLWTHFKTLMGLGIDQIITYQLHSDKSKSMIDPSTCAIDDVPGIVMLQKYLCDTFIQTTDYLEDVVKSRWLFCCVDAGSEKITKQFAKSFGSSLVIAHKQRDYSRTNIVQKITILSDTDIRDKDIWIIDDMIDTGGSVFELCKELDSRGVKSINIAVVHAVFSDPSIARINELCASGVLKNLVVTDTVPAVQRLKASIPCLHIVSSAAMSAEIVVSINEDRSLSHLFDVLDATAYLSSPRLF
jgi:ribose-phosphate pyrophosphokinase